MRFGIKYLFIISSLLFTGATNIIHHKAKTETLAEVLDDFAADTALSHAGWGIYLYDLSADKIIFQKNAQQSLVPASTMKIATTGAAFGLLGSNYRFKTTVDYTGKIDAKGVLHGNIIIHGGGDPTFGSWRFDSTLTSDSIFTLWADSFNKAGIKSITGNIIADGSHFDSTAMPATWTIDDLGNYYGAAAYGLNIDENIYTITLQAGRKVGEDVALVKTEPEIPGLLLVNNLKTGKSNSGDQCSIVGGPGSYMRCLLGTIPLQLKPFKVKGSLPYPVNYFASAFQKVLISKSIAILGQHGQQGTGAERQIASWQSPALKDIIHQTNLKSINLFAECLLKEIGWKIYGIGSERKGIDAIEDYWKKKGLDINGLFMEDACGLSRYDGISSQQLVGMLKIISKEPYYTDFYNSLAVAGETGALRQMCKGTNACSNLHAKSGHETRVRSYAGYVKNTAGENLAFGFIINNYTCDAGEIKDKMEKLLASLAE